MDEPIDSYKDIIDLPHHRSTTRQPLPSSARAAQFAPFAALSGHKEMLAETARHTDGPVELSTDEAAALSRRLNQIMSHEPAVRVAIQHFRPDPRKKGGTYIITTGKIQRIDPISHAIVLTDKTTIPLSYIRAIRALQPKK